MKDYYNLLGVSAHASQADIKSAFRKLVLRYHPDRNPSSQASEVIVEINEAYEVLSDPVKKQLYDSILSGSYTSVESPGPTATHRDPAYRKHPRNPAFKSKKQQTREMMQEYMHITQFMTRIAFALVLFIALDFLLPTTTQQETIAKVITPRTGRYHTSNLKFYTNTGTGFELTHEAAREFSLGMPVNVSYSLFVRVPTTIENITKDVSITVPTTIYGNFIFVPVLLLIVSTIGMFFKRETEFDFNVGVTNFLLTIFTLAFLFIHKIS